MEPLELRFDEGFVEGEGDDCVGPFTFSGTYSEWGEVHLVKQYVGKHRVDYRGRVGGEGAILGNWTIGAFWSGPFALMPVVEDVSRLAIQEIVAVPEDHAFSSPKNSLAVPSSSRDLVPSSSSGSDRTSAPGSSSPSGNG